MRFVTVRGLLHALCIELGDDEIEGRWGVHGSRLFDLDDCEIQNLAVHEELKIMALKQEERDLLD